MRARSTCLRPILLTALLCAASTAALADQSQITVYKWVDAHGVIHYSDQPHPDAKKLHVTGAQTYSAPPAAAPNPSQSPGATTAPAVHYNSCVITQPGDQQMLTNVHTATAVVQTDPALHPNNEIHLFFDGRQLSGNGPSFTFPVNRGQHTVSAVVVDGYGQIVCETSTVTFYVQQPSILNPNGPLYHRPRPH